MTNVETVQWEEGEECPIDQEPLHFPVVRMPTKMHTHLFNLNAALRFLSYHGVIGERGAVRPRARGLVLHPMTRDILHLETITVVDAQNKVWLLQPFLSTFQTLNVCVRCRDTRSPVWALASSFTQVQTPWMQEGLLHLAARFGCCEAVSQLLLSGDNPNATSMREGNTPLMGLFAASGDGMLDAQTVLQLAQMLGPVTDWTSARNKRGESALELALCYLDTRLLSQLRELLVTHAGMEAHINALNPLTLRSPLTTAIMRSSRHPFMRSNFGWIAMNGADAGMRDGRNDPPLPLLARTGYDEAEVYVGLLDMPGVDLDARDSEGCTCLMRLCADNLTLDAVTVLLDRGADPLLGAPGVGTPIWIAARADNAGAITRLLILKYGCDPYAPVPEVGGRVPHEHAHAASRAVIEAAVLAAERAAAALKPPQTCY